MKIILTKAYEKLAYLSVDDQPNFVKRDRPDQGSLFLDTTPDTKDSIKRKWKKKKRRKQIEEMPKASL